MSEKKCCEEFNSKVEKLILTSAYKHKIPQLYLFDKAERKLIYIWLEKNNKLIKECSSCQNWVQKYIKHLKESQTNKNTNEKIWKIEKTH